MGSLRLSSVFVACLPAILVLSFVAAHSQSPAAPPAASSPIQNLPPLTQPLPPLISSPSAPQAPQTFSLPPLSPNTISRLEALKAQQLASLARNEGPCYTLHTYGFTTGHEPAEAPRLSSHTTCTPASQSHAKAIVSAPPGR